MIYELMAAWKRVVAIYELHMENKQLRDEIARLQAELAHWETFGVAPAPNVSPGHMPRPSIGRAPGGDGKAGGDRDEGIIFDMKAMRDAGLSDEPSCCRDCFGWGCHDGDCRANVAIKITTTPTGWKPKKGGEQ